MAGGRHFDDFYRIGECRGAFSGYIHYIRQLRLHLYIQATRMREHLTGIVQYSHCLEFILIVNQVLEIW